MTKELTKTDNSQIRVGNFDMNHLDPIRDKKELDSYFLTLVKSGKISCKSVDECYFVFQRAKELNLPFTTGTEHIHVINGKTGVDIHIIRALLSKAGTITWTKTKDFVPQYEYTDGSSGYIRLPDYCEIVANKEAAKLVDKGKVGVWLTRYYQVDSKGTILPEYKLSPEKHVVVYTAEEWLSVQQEGKLPCKRADVAPIDYLTEYKFTRYKKINGKDIIQESYGRYSRSDAMTADSYGKDTYKKHEKIMIDTRAFTLGAREIASDVIQGCYEYNEVLEIESKNPRNSYIIDREEDIEDAQIVE